MPNLGDFDHDDDAGEELTFTLAGRVWHAVGDVPAGIVFDLAEKESLEDASAWIAFRDFLAGVVIEDERAEFLVAVQQVGLKRLLRVTQAVLAAVTGRPTQPPASSQD